jgi:hypothetical protein
MSASSLVSISKKLSLCSTEFISGDFLRIFDGGDCANFVKIDSKGDGILNVTAEGRFDSDEGFQSSLALQQNVLSNHSNNVRLDNLSITNNGLLTGELSIFTGAMSKLYIAVQDERSEPGKALDNSGKVGTQITLPNCDMDLNVDIVNGPIARARVAYKYNPLNLIFGAHMQVNTHYDDNKTIAGTQCENLCFGLSYNDPSYNLFAISNDLMSANSMISFGYSQSLSKNAKFGAMVEYGIDSNKQLLSSGAIVKLDDKTQLIGNINSMADVQATLTHSLSKDIKLEISTKMKLNESSYTPKTGIGISFFSD